MAGLADIVADFALFKYCPIEVVKVGPTGFACVVDVGIAVRSGKTVAFKGMAFAHNAPAAA